MSRARFIEEREPNWIRLGRVLSDLEQTRSRKQAVHGELPGLYRAVCEDLDLARHRAYGPALEQRLNNLALRGYHQLHGRKLGFFSRALRFLLVGFPQAVRAEGRLMVLCSVLFWGPFLGMTAAGHLAPEWVMATLPPEMASQLDEGFSGPQVSRDSSSNLVMFGFYIRNNVGIDFRTYAGGLLLGVGALFFLLYNALVLGAAFGYIVMQGHTESFASFVVGHGSPELWAVVISGAAGLRLGLAVLAPGRRSRKRALREDGRRSVRLAMGAAFMTTCAAFIEAFWSGHAFPLGVKLAAGLPLWVLVPLWLLLAGRRR